MSSAKRLKSIEIKGLFDTYDHTINLNLEERVTILHGINGCGKTTVLKLINVLSNLMSPADIVFLQSTPFSFLSAKFTDNSFIEIDKRKNQCIIKKNKKSTPENMDLKNLSNNNYLNKAVRYIEEELPELREISKGLYLDIETGKTYNQYDLILKYQKILPPSYMDRYLTKDTVSILNKFKEFFDSFNTYFFEVDRLLQLSRVQHLYSSRARFRYETQPYIEKTIELNARALADKIKQKLTEFGERSQRIDSEFPFKIFSLQDKETSKTIISKEDLLNRLNKLKEKREKLINIGLLDKDDKQINFEAIPQGEKEDALNDMSTKILQIHLEQTEEKLSIFDDLEKQTSLFQKLLNNRFSYSGKKIIFDKEKGIVLTNNKDNQIPLSQLSSGEQHEIVLFYGLLFDVKPDSLILIDEPELSLHPTWQMSFLKDMQEISTLTNLDFLIATHSPLIINDQDDLMVELEVQQHG